MDDGLLRRFAPRNDGLPPRNTTRIHPAIDDELGPGHVARGIRGKIQHALRDLFSMAGAAERRGKLPPLFRIGRLVLSGARRPPPGLAPDRRVDGAGVRPAYAEGPP